MIEEDKPNKSKSSAVPGKAQDIFEWWNEKCKIEPTDSLGIKAKKVGIRIIGILLLIIFSPILIAVFLTIIAVSL